MLIAGILSAIGGLGIYAGYEIHPVFYSQSVLLFGTAGYTGYKVLYADKKEELMPDNEIKGPFSESP